MEIPFGYTRHNVWHSVSNNTQEDCVANAICFLLTQLDWQSCLHKKTKMYETKYAPWQYLLYQLPFYTWFQLTDSGIFHQNYKAYEVFFFLIWNCLMKQEDLSSIEVFGTNLPSRSWDNSFALNCTRKTKM